MFRIKKEPKGFIVEYKTYKWTLFGLKEIWKPYVLTSGMDCAWHHSTSEFAIMNFKNETINSTTVRKSSKSIQRNLQGR